MSHYRRWLHKNITQEVEADVYVTLLKVAAQEHYTRGGG